MGWRRSFTRRADRCRLVIAGLLLDGGQTPSGRCSSSVQPHVVEARALGVLVEPLDVLLDGPQPVEVSQPDRRHLLVPEPRLLLPENTPPLGVGLARQLLGGPLDLLVTGPAGPRAGE